ncbi:MAG: chorismate lyase [Betaproteobacteria bacterium]|nr:chorismate lyase [Betaproteobacteria bacterium]
MKSDSQTTGWPLRLTGSQGRYRPWLLDRGSLTQRIQARCSAFSVRHVRQRNGMALPSERRMVALKHHAHALLRDVFLYCGETPMVFAHSVLPAASLHGSWQALGRLGNKPLGAALFSNPHVRRAPLRFKKLRPRDALYRLASAILPNPPTCLWARCSIFTLKQKPILVTEVFLPGILELRP